MFCLQRIRAQYLISDPGAEKLGCVNRLGVTPCGTRPAPPVDEEYPATLENKKS